MKPASLTLLACCLLASAGSPAQQTDTGSTTLSGFGTLAGVYNSDPNAGFRRDIGQPGEPGRHYNWKPDSRIGVQITHYFSPQLQFSGQMVAKDTSAHAPTDIITRAFVAYRPNEDWMLRVGRLADSTFLMSDYMEVGYSYPWVRPPLEAYGLIGMASFDGADVQYRLFGSDWRLKLMGGRTQARLPTPGSPDYHLNARPLRGIALIHDSGEWKFRLGHNQLKLQNAGSVDQQLNAALDPIAGAGIPGVSSEAASYLDSIPLAQAHLRFTSVGMSYDNPQWFMQAEVSRLDSCSKGASRGYQGYLGAGLHLGTWTPYFLLSRAHASRVQSPEHDWGSASPAQTLALSVINLSRSDQDSISLGIRRELDERSALKLQWDQVRVHDMGWRLWSMAPNADQQGRRLNLITLSLDFIF